MVQGGNISGNSALPQPSSHRRRMAPGWCWRCGLPVILGVLSLARLGSGQDAAVPAAQAQQPALPVRHLRAAVYAQTPEGPLTADVYFPAGTGPFPGLLLVRGGAWRAGSKWTIMRHGNPAGGHTGAFLSPVGLQASLDFLDRVLGPASPSSPSDAGSSAERLP